ncbi:MATE family efflux transporter [Shewanella surugensis]|uniref:MATE family efflux transporter n=2 Tax=Shewanella surugensis TaxID=212020 RepID=A0ABT0LKF2_9GAMM|nr:MATE family efflux transporter [Shewanella surugensis]
MTPPYLFWIALSLIPTAPALVLKSFTDAQNEPWVGVKILLDAVLLNTILNYILIFGKFGAPELGLLGAGLATFIARLLAFIAVFSYVFRSKKLARYRPEKWIKPIRITQLMSLLKMSLTISGQGFIISGAFSITAILMGVIGTIALASHQIALVFAMTGAIIPMGLSIAVSIRIGHVLGEKKPLECLTIFIGAQILGIVCMGAIAAIFIFHGREFLTWFFTDLDLIDLTTRLLWVVGGYLIFDSVQLISMGALRGYKDMFFPTVFLFGAFWLVALPLGALLTFYFGYGDSSLWFGLALGFILCAITLSIRFMFIYRSFNLTS